MTTRTTHKLISAMAIAALSLTACGSEDAADTDGGAGAASAPGVTADKIVLGHLTDLAGPQGPVGKQYLAGAQAYVKAVNADGGVCGRDLELLVRDHRYNAQEAVTAYREMSGKVLGMESLLGTAQTAALLPSLEKDNMLTSTTGWDKSLIDNDFLFLPGATYDVMTVNAVDWGVGELGLTKGDAIGVVVFDGAFGDAIFESAKAVAEERGLKAIEQRIAPTDTDFTGPITALKNGGAELVVLGVTAGQLGTIISSSESLGFKPTFVSPMPGNFDASLLKGSAKTALEERYYSGASFAAYATEGEGPEQARKALEAAGAEPSFGVMLGYAQANAYSKIIAAACEADENLTREGLLKAFQSMDSLETDGLIAELDFTVEPGKSQTQDSSILRADASVEGGLKQVEESFVSPLLEKLDL